MIDLSHVSPDPLRGWKMALVRMLLLIVSACTVLGAIHVGKWIVTSADSWMFGPSITEISEVGPRELHLQAHAWVRGIPGAERIPSVQYISQHEAILRIQQLVEGEQMVCTVYVDALGKRSSIGC